MLPTLYGYNQCKQNGIHKQFFRLLLLIFLLFIAFTTFVVFFVVVEFALLTIAVVVFMFMFSFFLFMYTLGILTLSQSILGKIIRRNVSLQPYVTIISTADRYIAIK